MSFEIDNIKKGNIKLYEQLFKHYYKPLIYFSFRYVKNKQVAEDVVHDVFVNIWKNRHNLDFTLNFKSYLYTSVRNESIKNISQIKKIDQVGFDIEFIVSHNSAPDSSIIKHEFEKEISNAISKLPNKCKEIFCLHRFDNLTYSEIALTLNLSVKTIETQMSRALKSLRENLSSHLK